MTGIGKSAARRIAAVALLCVPPCEASNTPPDIGGLEDGCDDCASGPSWSCRSRRGRAGCRCGGGWTSIGKVAAGNYTSLTNQAYTDLIANPTNDVNSNLLQDASVPSAGQIAFRNRAKTNALYHGLSRPRVVRVQMSGNLATVASNGTLSSSGSTRPPTGTSGRPCAMRGCGAATEASRPRTT